MSELLRTREREAPKELWRSLAAWFLGPKAENRVEFNNLVLSALNDYEDYRASYQPVDPPYVTESVKHSAAFQDEIRNLEDSLKQLNTTLKDSVPFFSARYKGHMVWDISIPSLAGYISGLLWNQNNVDSSTSTVTTTLEIIAGRQLCKMLGFCKNGGREPWGHITSCGSLANIEALWAARNLKLYPVALKNAIIHDKRLQLAAETATVYIPRLNMQTKLADTENWDLLNLDVDEVCSLAESVAKAADVPMKTLSSVLDDYSQTSLGMAHFLNMNQINCPVFFSPATNHYSWPKAATLLGMGYASLIQVAVDSDGRQDLRELEKSLERCLKEKIPVLSLVVIIGTTEESAVDPVTDIMKIREKFREKGLNFCIHADAAWGGYLMTMLLEPSGERAQRFIEKEPAPSESTGMSNFFFKRTHSIPTRLNSDPLCIQSLQDMSLQKPRKVSTLRRHDLADNTDFVPHLPLSPYVTCQYKALKDVDTITIDPHKAGFCVYPSGALCYRNGSMRGFITLAAPEVYHGENDPSVGVYGIEGSKPGAAAASVFLSHKVIGLDRFGHGRILGQCNFAAKLFYCMWHTVAKESDPFICVNFIKSRASSVTNLTAFIKEHIRGKPDRELYNNEKTMRFLAEIGPDALINTFVVNIKNDDGTPNANIQVANALQSDIFKELSGRVGMTTKRIPLFLTTSDFNAKKYGAALDDLKERLGLHDQMGDKTNLKFLRSTIMNPFQSSNGFVEKVAAIFRNTVLNCVAKIREKPTAHEFIGTHINRKGFLYAINIPSFDVIERRYQVVLKLKVIDVTKLARLRQMQKKHASKIMVLHVADEAKMYDIVRSCEKQFFHVKFASNESDLQPLNNAVEFVVEDVVKFDHLEPDASDVDYPLWQKYFIFGDEHEAYINHVMTKAPDFFQLIRLDKLPHSIPINVLDLGVDVTIIGVNGSPLIHSGTIHDPLQADKYSVKLRSTNNVEIYTEINMHENGAKLWFKEVM